MNTKIFAPIFVVLFITCFAAFFSQAATLQDELGFYLDKNESYLAQNITSAGKAYYVVKISGVDSIIFDSESKLVIDNATIDSASSAYAQELVNSLRSTSQFKAIGSDFNAVNENWRLCELTSRPVREDWFVYYHIAAEGGNDPKIKPSFDKLLDGTKALNTSFAEIKAQVDVLNSTASAQLKLSLEAIYNKIQTIKTQLTPYLEGTAYLRLNYAEDFAAPQQGIFRYICQLSSTSFSALESDLAIRSQVTASETIAAQLKAKTAERKPKGERNKQVASLSVQYNGILPSVSEARTKYVLAQGIIDSKLADLNAAFGKLNSSTNDNFVAYAADFNSAYVALQATIVKFADVYFDYNASKTQLSALDAALKKAEEKLGKSDERLIALKKQAVNLSLQFTTKEDDLKTVMTATAKDFASINSQAVALTAEASTLQSKANSIDFVTLGVMAILVIGLIGLVVYVIKVRRRPPKIGTIPSAFNNQ